MIDAESSRAAEAAESVPAEASCELSSAAWAFSDVRAGHLQKGLRDRVHRAAALRDHLQRRLRSGAERRNRILYPDSPLIAGHRKIVFLLG